MSFGFGVGDFVAISRITITLYRSFKNAFEEFEEVGRQLESLQIVIADLRDQADDEQSLLNRNGAQRKGEFLVIHDNLMQTMSELGDLHKRAQQMGRRSWTRFRLGQQDLSALRGRLTIHIAALTAFAGSLTMSAVSRLEPMIQRIYDILNERARQGALTASSVLDAVTTEQEGMDQLINLELRSEGIPQEFIDDNRGAITSIAWSVVEANSLFDDNATLVDFERIEPDVSSDQMEELNIRSDQIEEPSLNSNDRIVYGNIRTFTSDEAKTRIKIMNHTGFDVKTIKPSDSKSSTDKTEKAVIWAASYAHSIEPLQLLLACGADPSTPGTADPAIIVAAKAQLWDWVRLLIHHGAQLHQQLFHIAAIFDSAELVSELISRGYNVNTTENVSYLCKTLGAQLAIHEIFHPAIWTALHTAAHFGCLRTTAVLLDRGADCNAFAKEGGTDCNGWDDFFSLGDTRRTPLFAALTHQTRSAEVVRILLERGAHVNGLCNEHTPPTSIFTHKTALWVAVDRSFPRAVRLLIQHGAAFHDTIARVLLRHTITKRDSGVCKALLEMSVDHGIPTLGSDVLHELISGYLNSISTSSGTRRVELRTAIRWLYKAGARLDVSARRSLHGKDGLSMLDNGEWSNFPMTKEERAHLLPGLPPRLCLLPEKFPGSVNDPSSQITEAERGHLLSGAPPSNRARRIITKSRTETIEGQRYDPPTMVPPQSLLGWWWHLTIVIAVILLLTSSYSFLLIPILLVVLGTTLR
ncbi:hypothetical protein ONS96_001063 [Cadophora gregata f. sp. sojae]|nr:hypothetical protein ONS96_001063 [Cadophora gregata f. sp. sojae]